MKNIFKLILGFLIFSSFVALIVSFLLSMGLTLEQINDGLNILIGTSIGIFVLICIYQEWKVLREEEKEQWEIMNFKKK